MKERLLYPDICKFLAIFLVTWAHCAQCVSGKIWTNFLGGMQLDIAFNMPMFMLISGWFIDPDKMRKSNIIEFITSKFKRLLIPSFVWYLINSALSLSKPGFAILTYYWYLNALFICLCVIMLFSKIFKKNTLCCLFSIAFIIAIPYSNISLLNFMLPFLWAGYGLRKIFNTKWAKSFTIICCLIGFGLCLMWNKDYTVYRSPLNSLFIDKQMLFAYVYRFAIGFTLSTVIIYVIMKSEKKLHSLAHLGTYSLVIYTASLAIIRCLTQIFNHLNIHTNEYIIIDLASLVLCLAIVWITILFTNYCRKHKMLRMLFLGE